MEIENIERGSQTDVTDKEKRSETDAVKWEHGFEGEITNDEAETIIRSCGALTAHLWPRSFPSISAELYCSGGSAYSNLDGEATLIADGLGFSWDYHMESKVLAVGLESGAVGICKFIAQ